MAQPKHRHIYRIVVHWLKYGTNVALTYKHKGRINCCHRGGRKHRREVRRWSISHKRTDEIGNETKSPRRVEQTRQMILHPPPKLIASNAHRRKIRNNALAQQRITKPDNKASQ